MTAPAAANPMHPPTPAEHAFREVLRVTGLLKRVTEPHFARFGLSPAQWGILRTLQRCEAGGVPPPRVTDLSALLLIRPPSVSGVVDRLERMGLAGKTASAGDARSRHVGLTEAGRRLVEQVLERHAEWIGSLMAGLTEPEHEEVRRLMAKLGAHLRPLADREEAGRSGASREDGASATEGAGHASGGPDGAGGSGGTGS